MYNLYVDNFRGFSRALIPIKQVNFFVGENSTGKSSILGLLSNLFDRSSSLSDEFDPGKIFPKEFDDLVSIYSKDRSSFSVGIFFDSDEGIRGELKTYKKSKGYPELKSYSRIISGSIVMIQKRGTKVFFKVIKCPKSINIRLVKLIEQKAQEKTGWSEMKGFPGASGIPVSHFVSIVFLKYFEKDKQLSNSISFGPDHHDLFSSVAFFDPIRAKPKKTYDDFTLEYSPTGDHTPYLIKNLMGDKKRRSQFDRYISEIGKLSGLFDKLAVKKYSIEGHSPFELIVLRNGKKVRIGSVGYGVSQILPIIVEMFRRKYESCFFVQQPEVHLHPKAQAAFGDILGNLAVRDAKSFVVETHSDYLIDRFRSVLRNTRKSQVDSQILYFESKNTGNDFFPIEIDEKGNVSSKQPKSYRNFFVKEELSNLGF